MLCHLFIHIMWLSSLQRVYTDADLYDPKILRRGQEVLILLDEFIRKHNLTLPESLDLVIDLFYKEEEIHATYYYVDHQARCIFFLDNFLVENMSGAKGVKAVNTYQHLRKLYETFLCFILILTSNLGHEIEAQYW